MKTRFYPKKYKHSTYNGNRILCIDAIQDECGDFIEIKTLKQTLKLWCIAKNVGNSDLLSDYNADAFLCFFQYYTGIDVQK